MTNQPDANKIHLTQGPDALRAAIDAAVKLERPADQKSAIPGNHGSTNHRNYQAKAAGMNFNEQRRNRERAAERARLTMALSTEAPLLSPAIAGSATMTAATTSWPEPKPLPNGLPKVEPFSLEFLPDRIAPWVGDIAKRLQCPPDFVGVAAVTALGSVIGRRVGIKPQEKTDWTEHPNIWGVFIGRPGLLKSPAMTEALKPIHRLEAEAAKNNDIAQKAYEAGINDFELRKKVKASLTKDALKKNKGQEPMEIKFELGEEPPEPLPVRYRTNEHFIRGNRRAFDC